MLKRCNSEELVLEEGIVQDAEMFSFSNSSTNTLRIITIVDKNMVPHIARAVLRIGRGESRIDNFSSGGMSAQVDVQTGIIMSSAIDKNGQEYLIHPDTKKQIIGFRIPGWEDYKNFALELASKYPQMHYIGWDIVKDREGNMCVIEANREAGADVMEANLLYGLMPIYRNLYEMGM